MRERSREHPEKLVGWLVGGEISWGVTSGSDGRAARRGLRVFDPARALDARRETGTIDR